MNSFTSWHCTLGNALTLAELKRWETGAQFPDRAGKFKRFRVHAGFRVAHRASEFLTWRFVKSGYTWRKHTEQDEVIGGPY